MLLRLCLVMLRLGQRAFWHRAREDTDDLQALSELLEAAQPSPVADADHSPGAAAALARQRSGCCFPASPDVLISLLAKTKINPRTLRAIAKRYLKLQAAPPDQVVANQPALQPPRSTTVRPSSFPLDDDDDCVECAVPRTTRIKKFMRRIGRATAKAPALTYKMARWRKKNSKLRRAKKTT